MCWSASCSRKPSAGCLGVGDGNKRELLWELVGTTGAQIGAKRCEATRSDAKRREATRSEAKRREVARSGVKRSEAKRSEAKRNYAKRREAKRAARKDHRREMRKQTTEERCENIAMKVVAYAIPFRFSYRGYDFECRWSQS